MISPNRPFSSVKSRFCVGWNQQSDFSEVVLIPYREYISELYFSLPLSLEFGKATEEIGTLPFMDYRQALRSMKEDVPHLTLNLLNNFACMGTQTDKCSLSKLLDAVDIIGSDLIGAVTVSNLLLAELYLKKMPHLKLHLSVRMNIDTLEQVAALVERYGENEIYCINIGRNAVYDFPTLIAIKNRYPSIQLKVILNEFCTHRCLDSDLHSLMTAHASYNQSERFTCAAYNDMTWWRFFTGQGVLPRDVEAWNETIDLLKVSSRWLPSETIARIMRAYTTSEEVSLGEILSAFGQGGTRFRKNSALLSRIDLRKSYPKDFFERRSRCNFACSECEYCKNVALGFELKSEPQQEG